MLGGFAVFSIIGYLSYQSGLPVDQVIAHGWLSLLKMHLYWLCFIHSCIVAGPGLTFVAYPEALSQLPLAPVWSVLFFVTLFTIGIDSQVSAKPFMIRCRKKLLIMSYLSNQLLNFFRWICTCSLECLKRLYLPWWMNSKFSKNIVFGFARDPASYCSFWGSLVWSSVIISTAEESSLFIDDFRLICVTEAGMYWVQIIDWYCAFLTLLVICLIECFLVGWVYGKFFSVK